MKKFLIATVTVILVLVIIDTAYYRWGFFINFSGDDNVATFTSTEGKQILVDTGEGLEPFEIRGVDMGAGIPGKFSTEFAIDKNTYLRWFKQIKEMGANTIRVYTVLPESFYEAVYEYNTDNSDPLYIIHGVWLNDYVLNSHADGYDDDFFGQLQTDCKALVDVIHGQKKTSVGYNGSSAGGTFTKDISPWVLGYIIGVEWEDVTVAYTDRMNEDRNSYEGRYMYTTEDATPFEAMLAEVGDSMIAYESLKYKQQRLIAFSNWPTTDPIDYPQNINELFQKCAKVDVEHIKTTEHFKSGQFASYHIYPYYPDYLSYYNTWKTEWDYAGKYLIGENKYNTYGVYLEMIARHHEMPVIVSEFGVSTGRGRAQNDTNTGRAQGHMSEQQQGEAIVTAYNDIMKAGCAGCVIFTWQDEWFKRTWNTMANIDLKNTAYWSDYQTNEQYFGLLSFDPGEKKSICYTDGDVSDWSESELVCEQDGYKLYMKYDEKYIYFRVHKDGGIDIESDKLYIPLDITPKTGSYYEQSRGIKFDRPADFLVVFDGKQNSKVVVQERYDVFDVTFAEYYRDTVPFWNPPDKNSPVFNEIYLAMQLEPMNITAAGIVPDRFPTGKLVYGSGNPDDEDFNSLSDFIIEGEELEMRLPWQLLNFANPTQMYVHDDYYEHYGIEYIKIKEIYAGIGTAMTDRIALKAKEMKGWGKKPTYHERLKESYYIVQDLWAEDAS